jgi:hypothetical protein
VSLMKNIKVIQHIHGIEHITDKLLQTKSLEFTYESLVIFEASLTTSSRPICFHNFSELATSDVSLYTLLQN